MNNLAKHVPVNPWDHEQHLRNIIAKHSGDEGHPTQWVVDAVSDAFAQAFGVGFRMGMLAKQAGPIEGAFRVEPPAGVVLDHDAARAGGAQTIKRIERREGDIDV